MPTVVDELITALKLTGVDEYRSQLRSTTTSMEAFAAVEATALQNLGGVAAGLITAVAPLEVLRRGLDFVNASFKQFAEDDAIARRVGFALQQIKSSVPLQEFQQLADRISDVTGADNDLILAQTEVLSRFQLTGQQIQQLLPGIVDLAARTGKELDQVSLAVGSALLGRVQGLARLGVEFKRTGDRAQDFAAILRQLEQFRGAGEQAGRTPAGRLAAQAVAEEDVRSAVGGRFAPTGQILLDVQTRFQRFLKRQTEAGNLDALLGVDLARSLTFQDVAEAGTAAARARRGLPRRDERAAAEAALAPPPSGNGAVERAIQETAANTRNINRTLLRGGGTTAQGAVSIRELNQALGAR